MNRTRKALGTVRQELPPTWWNRRNGLYRTNKDGSRSCMIHGTVVMSGRGYGSWRQIWSKCPDCFPITAHRARSWRDGLWL